MKKDAAFFFAMLVVLAALSISVVGAAADPVVTFPDHSLEQAVRDAIGKPSGEIHQSDLAPLTVLAAKEKGIARLDGIEHCVNLKTLTLHDNQIENIAPLSGLTNLEYLYLNRNQISDVAPLSGLTSLVHLYLEINQVTDIGALSGLTKLEHLLLTNNQISNIDPVSGLTKLSSLSFFNNKLISDISALSGLTELTSLLLSSNQIENIAPLSGLVNLKKLWLSSNEINDIGALKDLTNLRDLSLRFNQISDIHVLSGMTYLYQLVLNGNHISTIDALRELKNLMILGLGNNQIGNIDALSELTRLSDLGLSDNQISDIDALSGLTNLEYLGLDDNQIGDIGPLVSNPGLGAGDEVGISRNWLCLTPGSEDMNDIQELLSRGVELWYTPQLAPSDLSATAVSSTGIDLQWNGDDVVHEDGFKIERNKGSGTYSEIATVGPDATTYSDTGLTSLTAYCYRVRATNAGGETCYSNEACATTPVSPPVADFTYAPGCAIAGAEIAFTDASADDGAVVAWAWGFGDGSTSSEQHPSHRFASFGSYTVTLRVTDDDGATDETSQVVRVYLRGDLNGDDVVDLIDVLMLHRHVHDGVEFDACQAARADIDDDGDVDEDDAQALADRVFVR